jgi:hypothetical protein
MAKYCRQIVYCKDCIHRPKKIYEDDNGGLILEFPDYKCICRCKNSDCYCSEYPADYFFCAYGEDKENVEENELIRITIDNTLNNLDKIETEFYTLKDLSGINNIEENK